MVSLLQVLEYRQPAVSWRKARLGAPTRARQLRLSSRSPLAEHRKYIDASQAIPLALYAHIPYSMFRGQIARLCVLQSTSLIASLIVSLIASLIATPQNLRAHPGDYAGTRRPSGSPKIITSIRATCFRELRLKLAFEL
jgi:hypothetical protein